MFLTKVLLWPRGQGVWVKYKNSFYFWTFPLKWEQFVENYQPKIVWSLWNFGKFSPQPQFDLLHCSQNTGGQEQLLPLLLLLDSPLDGHQGRPDKRSVSLQKDIRNREQQELRESSVSADPDLPGPGYIYLYLLAIIFALAAKMTPGMLGYIYIYVCLAFISIFIFIFICRQLYLPWQLEGRQGCMISLCLYSNMLSFFCLCS